jgi:hypothetical protein
VQRPARRVEGFGQTGNTDERGFGWGWGQVAAPIFQQRVR